MRLAPVASSRLSLSLVLIGSFLAPTAAAADGELLHLKGATFDPMLGAPAIDEALRWNRDAADPGAPAAFVVQLREPTTEAAKEALAAAGATVVEYVPENAWIVRAAPADADRVGALPIVRAVTPLHPAFRIDAQLIDAPPDGPARLNVFLFEVVEDVVPTVEALTALGVAIVDAEDAHRLTVVVAPDAITAIARLPDVQWVQPEPVLTLRRNDQAVWVLQTNVSNQTSLWTKGLRGTGQVIGHIDDPLDLNNCYFRDPSVANAGPTHRKVVLHSGGTATNGDHGEHTAATAAGDQQPINGTTFRNGHADKAKLAHANQSLVSGTNLYNQLNTLWGAGSRVYTNSWGNDTTTAYDNWSRDIDRFSRDNEDALVCWAVTNTGSLKNPENAKNCLAVGATQKSPSQQSFCSGGAGPTSDGRRKPEIFAPGCSTQSANAGTNCGTQALTGTSMASPAIAGVAALAREYFMDGFYPTGVGSATSTDAFTPTGALLKAVLINSSVDMTGIGGFPSNQEGWGRLLAENTLYFAGDSHGLFVQDVRKANGFTGPSQNHTYTIDVASSARPLEITLAWHDQHAALNASLTPVNDLNLRVTSPSGTVHRGNVFAGGQSTTGGAHDTLNNVERVRRNSPTTGTWKIEVLSANVPSPNQGYGLAATADLTQCPSPTVYGTPQIGSQGTPGLTRWTGTPSVSAGNFTVTASGFNPNSFAVMFTGTATATTPTPWGTILVGGFVTRTIFFTDASGAGSIPITIQPSQIGFTRRFQCVVRDPGFGGNVQAGDAITAQFCP